MCTPSWSIVTGTPPIDADATETVAVYFGFPPFVIVAETWIPSITICPPPRLTRPSLDSPLVTSLWVVGSTVARVDDSSSDSPSAGGAVDADANERDGVVMERADARGVGGNGTVTGDGGGCTPPTGTAGVVTVATGVGTVTVGAAGSLPLSVGFFRPSGPCHFAFQAASTCRRRPSNPRGTASLI